MKSDEAKSIARPSDRWQSCSTDCSSGTPGRLFEQQLWGQTHTRGNNILWFVSKITEVEAVVLCPPICWSQMFKNTVPAEQQMFFLPIWFTNFWLSRCLRPSSIVASTSRCGRDDLSSILRKGIFLPRDNSISSKLALFFFILFLSFSVCFFVVLMVLVFVRQGASRSMQVHPPLPRINSFPLSPLNWPSIGPSSNC